MLIPFGFNWRSDRLKRLIYHETAHVSQFARFGSLWWKDYVTYIASVSVHNLTNPFFQQTIPYGNGDLPGASRAELTEGMASSIENYMADLQYGLDHSNGTPPQNQRYMNVAEGLLFWVNPGLPTGSIFIPEGLYFDLLDMNNTPPISRGERNGITDTISGFTFEQQYDAFGPTIITIPQFRDQLFTLHGTANGAPLSTYLSLFSSYGH